MDMTNGVDFGLWYDLRNPPRWPRAIEQLYAEVLDQIAEAERLGFGSAWFTEHHFYEDGYLPSPLVFAAAVAARTKELRLGTNLMLPAFHNPARLAEDAAILGIVSGGRFNLGVAVGYKADEFEAFGQSIRFRPSLLEESIAILRKAWAGESIAFAGKRFAFPDVRVTPVPSRTPNLLIGGMNEVAIDRVARLGDGFLSTVNDHHELYFDALRRAGEDPANGRIYAGQWAIVSEDPERTWASIGEHALYQMNMYIAGGSFGPPETTPLFPDAASILATGAYKMWDAATAVKELTELLRARPQIRDVHFWAQLPGESVADGSVRMRYIAEHVIPEVRANLRAS